MFMVTTRGPCAKQPLERPQLAPWRIIYTINLVQKKRQLMIQMSIQTLLSRAIERVKITSPTDVNPLLSGLLMSTMKS